ncbi:hypothetical protein [Nocardia anaemiae]|uniref:hypothetical protein n=1 Tax=Nocardia anaemiae TaxID=263910 RepID=UPI0007A4CDBF|nr:hypothetical protein [Nocardia anaemiae]
MAPDFDDLEFARQELRIAVAELAESAMSPELRVQLGLLAAQIALADHLPAALPLENYSAASDSGDSPPDPEAIADGIEWTTALAEKILRTSTPGGFRLVQALVAEGGSASVDKLVDLTGDAVLQSATQSLNMAARRVGIVHHLPDRRLIQAYRYPNRSRPRCVPTHFQPNRCRRFPQRSASWTNYTAESTRPVCRPNSLDVSAHDVHQVFSKAFALR